MPRSPLVQADERIARELRRRAIYCPISALSDADEHRLLHVFARLVSHLGEPHSQEQEIALFRAAGVDSGAFYRGDSEMAWESFSAVVTRLGEAAFDLTTEARNAGFLAC